ncbi:hypothetical protein PMAG_b0517 [Pseudoalteromonas mariniglutinosa NCIMB 1770]|nr:hypothetical protein [Pseudoalteromonas mariniglutinosa NCIMB 1770]
MLAKMAVGDIGKNLVMRILAFYLVMKMFNEQNTVDTNVL